MEHLDYCATKISIFLVKPPAVIMDGNGRRFRVNRRAGAYLKE